MHIDVVLAFRICELFWYTVVEQLTCFICRFFTVELYEAKTFTDEIPAKFWNPNIADFSSSVENFCNLRVCELGWKVLNVNSRCIHSIRIDPSKIKWKPSFHKITAFAKLKDVGFGDCLLQKRNLFSFSFTTTTSSYNRFDSVKP